MDTAVCLPRTTGPGGPSGRVFPRLAIFSRVDQAGPAAADTTVWPVLWARCWMRVRTWGVPPRWSVSDWCAEARPEGALADTRARRAFEPRRGVPLDAFRYRRVIEAVWNRYRQEASFGRRAAAQEGVERDAPARSLPDP